MLVNSGRLRFIRIAIQNCQFLSPTAAFRSNKFYKIQQRGRKDDSTNISSLFIPVQVKANPDDINVGAELTGTLNKADLLKVLNKFYQRKEIKQLLTENGLDRMYMQ